MSGTLYIYKMLYFQTTW